MSRLVIDPVTRIGGHLRIEAEVAGGAVVDAWSSGAMFRGIENLLVGRDPRDAWMLAERICGSCSGVHGLASARAVEAALGVRIPRNARLLRNLVAGVSWLSDLVTGFYQRSVLDWVDVAAAARADPYVAARLAASTNPSAGDSSDALSRVELELGKLPSSLLVGTASGHPAFHLSPEADLVLVAHYLRALDLQRTFARAATTLGGKDPHPQTFLIGGMTLAPPWGGPSQMTERGHPNLPERATPAALSLDGLIGLEALLLQLATFVENVFVPDVVAVARGYPEWFAMGAGAGELLAYGDLALDDTLVPNLLLPGGRVMDGHLDQVYQVDEPDITESVAHAWYEDPDLAPHPVSDGTTVVRYDGPVPITSLEDSQRYSYVKAARYAGLVPMESGPMARMLVGYLSGSNAVRQAVDEVVAAAGAQPTDLLSTMGRMLARAAEAKVIAQQLAPWLNELRANLATGDYAVADLTSWHPGAWPSEASGFALVETSRGALGHWVTIRDGLVSRYQVVDGSTWNVSPRDGAGRRGPLESALIGTPVADIKRPLEVLRTVHSFDPCVACATHAFHAPASRAVHASVGGVDP